MDRNCDSCARKNECGVLKGIGEDQRGIVSCERYRPMDIEEYVMWRKNKYSTLLIDTKGVDKYFKY